MRGHDAAMRAAARILRAVSVHHRRAAVVDAAAAPR